MLDFLHDYLWPSLKMGFKYAAIIAGVGTILIFELWLVLITNEWAIFTLLFVGAIDYAIIRALDNYEKDKERVENGWEPCHRGK